MFKIYFNVRRFTLLFFTFLVFSSTIKAQVVCAVSASPTFCTGTAVVQNFDFASSGFVGTGGLQFSPTTTGGGGTDGSFRTTTNIASGGTATFTSPTFSSENLVTFGLEVEQGANSFSFLVQLLDAAGNVLPGVGCTGSTTNANNIICVNFGNISASTSTGVRVRFTFTNTTNSTRALEVDDFAMAPAGAVLPVKFSKFDAKHTSSGTLLTWTIDSDSNPHSYEIERSDDGTSFNKIGSVNATDNTTYSFTDNRVTQGVVFYRIKSLDRDGNKKYSNIINIANGKVSNVLNAFPMPTKGKFTLQHSKLNENAKITISNVEGKILQTITPMKGSIQTDLNLSSNNYGIYVIRLENGNNVEYLKILKH
jgi:hypothetical protein